MSFFIIVLAATVLCQPSVHDLYPFTEPYFGDNSDQLCREALENFTSKPIVRATCLSDDAPDLLRKNDDARTAIMSYVAKHCDDKSLPSWYSPAYCDAVTKCKVLSGYRDCSQEFLASFFEEPDVLLSLKCLPFTPFAVIQGHYPDTQAICVDQREARRLDQLRQLDGLLNARSKAGGVGTSKDHVIEMDLQALSNSAVSNARSSRQSGRR